MYAEENPDTGITEISDNNLDVVAKYIPTGRQEIWGPEQELEVINEPALIAALKVNFIESNLADVYAESYDEIFQQQSNSYDY